METLIHLDTSLRFSCQILGHIQADAVEIYLPQAPAIWEMKSPGPSCNDRGYPIKLDWKSLWKANLKPVRKECKPCRETGKFFLIEKGISKEVLLFAARSKSDRRPDPNTVEADFTLYIPYGWSANRHTVNESSEILQGI